MFFTYRQNNSGGRFDGPVYVCVEANSFDEANQFAVDSGFVYFDGVKLGTDCSCCGNRWRRLMSSEDCSDDELPVFDRSYRVFYQNGTVTTG